MAYVFAFGLVSKAFIFYVGLGFYLYPLVLAYCYAFVVYEPTMAFICWSCFVGIFVDYGVLLQVR